MGQFRGYGKPEALFTYARVLKLGSSLRTPEKMTRKKKNDMSGHVESGQIGLGFTCV